MSDSNDAERFDAALIKIYSLGATLADLADVAGMSRKGIRWRLEQLGVSRRPPGPPSTQNTQDPAMRAEAVRVYREGGTLEDSAAVLGCRAPAAWLVLREEGVEFRHTHSATRRRKVLAERNRAIVAAHAEGESARALAERHGLSVARIWQIIGEAE